MLLSQHEGLWALRVAHLQEPKGTVTRQGDKDYSHFTRQSFRPQEQASVYMLSKGRSHQLACKAEVKSLPCFSLACETAVLRPADQQATYYAQARS